MQADQAMLGLLAMLAEQCGEKVSQERAVFMARKLLPLGAEQVCHALERMLETARRFPTIGEIKSEMGIRELSDEDKGREVAERIWATLCSGRGSSPNRDTQLQNDAYVGPIGAAVVRMAGGWHRLAESTKTSEETARKAQWREFAAIIAEKGGIGDAPQLEGAPRPTLEPAEQERRLRLLKMQRELEDKCTP